MALTKCIECGAEISTDAKVCPSCGTSKPHKTNYKKMLIIGAIILVVFTVFTIQDKSKSSENTNLSQPDTSGESPIFNKLEASVYSALIYDDLCKLVDGEESIIASRGVINPTPIVVSSKKLQTEYEKNEVAADQQYKNKLVSVSGIVKGINKSIGDTIIVGLNGGENPFIHPGAIINNQYANWAASLKNGDDTGLVCVVNGMTVGSVTLGDCIPSYDWANNTSNQIISNTKSGIDNNDPFFTKMVEVTKKISSNLKNDSKCLSDNSHNECMEEIAKASKNI